MIILRRRSTAAIICFVVLFACCPLFGTAGTTDKINTAVSLMKMKEMAQAKKILQPLAEAQDINDEQKAYVYYLLSACSEGSPEALIYIIKSADLNPKSRDAHEQHATLLYKAKRYEEAISAATKALEIAPASVRSWVVRGLAYRESGDLEKSIADLTTALSFDASNGPNYLRRGKAYHSAKNFDKALDDFRKAHSLKVPGEQGGECAYYIGEILYSRKEWGNARNALLHAQTLIKNGEKLRKIKSMLLRIEAEIKVQDWL